METLLEQYKKSSEPIPANFRQLVRNFSVSDRATHLIHSYPAKLLTHIPYYFLSNNFFSKKGSIVLDPFCGSGTVLLESLLTGHNAIGADANPLARLIAKVKVFPLKHSILTKSISELKNRIPTKTTILPPDVVNINHWFHSHVIEQLCCLLEAINSLEEINIRDFFLVCFSNCVRRVSLADPRLSVPVRLQYGQYPNGHKLREKTDKHLESLQDVDVKELFFKIVQNNCERMETLNTMLPKNVKATIPFSDARNLSYENHQDGNCNSKLPDKYVDLVITSPPYAGAQKYIRASSLNLGWLGLCLSNELKNLEQKNIGREHFKKESYIRPTVTNIKPADALLEHLYSINPLRAHIAATYLIEMREVFKEISRVVKSNGNMILIAANNHVCGLEFETQEYLRILAEEQDFRLSLRLIDQIRSRGLMTKRNKTASLISREWVLVFRRK